MEHDLAFWHNQHSDAWHPGTRETCADCQAVIRAFGPMPPHEAIRRYRPPKKPQVGYVKQRIPRALRRLVLARDNHTCRHCGTTHNLRADHIVPERDGGPTTLGNLQTLCQSCNSRKGARR